MKITDVYLVDCENVGSRRIVTDREDLLVYYFTSNQVNMQDLSKFEKEIHLDHTDLKNAVDFIIDSRLGFLICHYGKSVNYHIVSKDLGYNYVIQYWGSLGYSVDRLESLGFQVSDETKFKLKSEFGFIQGKFTQKAYRKLCNIYFSWLNTKRHNYGHLDDMLLKSFWNILDTSERKILCDYLYYIGLDIRRENYDL